jgi:K+ transporter
LHKNKAFGVNIEQKVEKTKPSPEELLSIPIPIGEPSGTFSKIDEMIIEEEKAKEDELDKVLDEAIQVETNEEVLEDELAELNDILNQDKALVEKEIIMEAPIAEKPKAKRGRKAKIAVDEPLINVDLKTAKIREQLVSDMLPKPTEKVIIKAPAYYMNNRKLYVQKLNELFQPYRKEIMADDTGISCEARQDNKEFELLTHQKIVRDYIHLIEDYYYTTG